MIRSVHRPKGPALVGLVVVFGLGLGHRAATAEDFRFEEVTVWTPDSIPLATDVYLPVTDGLYPVVLARSPYGSKSKAWLGRGLAPAGYVVVLQNVRGTHGSGGEFFPFAYEKADGTATLHWVLDQPWCNGKVGLWGASYYGYAAFELATTGHPALQSQVHVSGWSKLEPFLSHGGAFHLMAHLRWFYSYASGQPDPPQEAWDQIFRTVPIGQFFQGAEAVMEKLAAAPYDYTTIRTPVLHITGWYDWIYPNVLQTWEGIAAGAHAPMQHMIIGPWAHNDVLNGVTKVGDEDFGPKAKMGLDSVLLWTRQWFDHTLKDTDERLTRQRPVRVFVMGDNDWLEFNRWPPADIDYQQWFIDSKGTANSSSGSGMLARSGPSQSTHDTFVFDPQDPVPTVGGSNSHFFPENLGPKNQAEVETRRDVLCYTSAPLASDLRMVGPIGAVIYAATEGTDTDITAKLTVVRPDGYVRNIEDGIVRGRYLFPQKETGGFLTPGEVYRFTVDCGATALHVKQGDRLRLEISSSNFPKYDRNPNTGADPFYATEFKVVKQTVYHDAAHPTHIVIPVLK